MKLKQLIPAVLVASVMLIGSCKKDDTNKTGNNTPLVKSGSPEIPSDADGALYCIKNTITYSDFGTPTTEVEGTAMAWFNNYTTSDDAGSVYVNVDSLSRTISGTGFMLPWYVGFGGEDSSGTINFSSPSATWKVGGSSKVNAFTYTDNTPFPTVTFTAPATVSTKTALTVNFSIGGAHDGIVCSLSGENDNEVNKAVAKNATSVTFTAAEVNSCSPYVGSQLGIQIMPCAITSTTTNGKKYYFVKQGAFAQYSEVID